MSIHVGDRATYRGQSVVVMEPASFLGERRWKVTRTRVAPYLSFLLWNEAIAKESALSNITAPSFQVGDSVRVGIHPKAPVAVVDSIVTGLDRPFFSVTIPAEIRKTDAGTRWQQDAYEVTLGGELLRGTTES